VPASIRRAVRSRTSPDCEQCPCGAELSITVLFPGAGTVDGGRIVYSAQETAFEQALEDRISPDESACCPKILLVAGYDPAERARANAAQIAAILDALLAAEAVTNDWVTKIWVHLVGFSAGGIVAVQTASRVGCGPRAARPGRSWCGRPMEPAVPVELDVVTMATPFDFPDFVSFFASVGTFLADLVDSDSTFEWSIGTNDYGGRRPSCLCRFTAFVSSGDYDDTSGADSPPDDRLGAWNAVKFDVPSGPGLTHVGVPARVLADHPGTLDGRCGCV
jgi:hypothetical protein